MSRDTGMRMIDRLVQMDNDENDDHDTDQDDSIDFIYDDIDDNRNHDNDDRGLILLLIIVIITSVTMTMMMVTKMMIKMDNYDSGLRTRTVHCIQAHSVVDEKLCDAAVSFNL